MEEPSLKKQIQTHSASKSNEVKWKECIIITRILIVLNRNNKKIIKILSFKN